MASPAEPVPPPAEEEGSKTEPWLLVPALGGGTGGEGMLAAAVMRRARTVAASGS